MRMMFVADSHFEVPRKNIKLFPGYRNTLDDAVLLPLKGDNGLVEDDAFIIFSIHPHQTLHKVLRDGHQHE